MRETEMIAQAIDDFDDRHLQRLTDKPDLRDLTRLRDLAKQAAEHATRYPEQTQRPVRGDGSGLPAGTVVIDKDGQAWQRYSSSWASATYMDAAEPLLELLAPYSVVYTPEGGK